MIIRNYYLAHSIVSFDFISINIMYLQHHYLRELVTITPGLKVYLAQANGTVYNTSTWSCEVTLVQDGQQTQNIVGNTVVSFVNGIAEFGDVYITDVSFLYDNKMLLLHS